MGSAFYNTGTEEDFVRECWTNFYIVATLQGKLAYLLMSIHAVNPAIFTSICSYDLNPILYSNMVYGSVINIFFRPSLSLIGIAHRISFSILGSLMFNRSSLIVYEWLKENLDDRPYLLTFLGFLCGRIMMIHWQAFLYHVDTRTIGVGQNIRRDSIFESMYL